LIWIAFLLGLELANRYLGVSVHLTGRFVVNAWACTHLLVCGLFLVHANRRLRWNFRHLATQSVSTPWWKRFQWNDEGKKAGFGAGTPT
jgi:hypothetical protein